MRKSELLKHIPEKIPDHNLCKIIRTPGRKVLMTILPGWEVMQHEKAGLIIHFTWKDGYLTYYKGGGYWTRQSLSTVYYNAYVSQSGIDEKSIEAVRSFTNRSYANMSAIEFYEHEIQDIKHEKALESKQKRIDRFMADVPALPKDFRRQCEKKLRLSGEEKINVKLFQPYKGIILERIFVVAQFKNMVNIGDGKVHITEICRAYTEAVAGVWFHWYYGEKYGRYGRRQHFWDAKSGSCVGMLPLRHYVYDNLDSLGLSKAQKDTLRILDGRCDPTFIIRRVQDHPEIEYVAKRGCLRLAAELVNEGGVNRLPIGSMTSENWKKLKAIDGGRNAVELLEIAPKIQDRYLKDFCKIKGSAKAGMIINLAKDYNINHVYGLLLKTGGLTVPVIQEYRDYLSMAARLGNNPKDEIIYRNKRWQEWHDRYSEEIDRRELKDKNREENKKFKNISRDYKLNSRLFSWEDKDYIIMVPKNAGEINLEGRQQHHCVGSSSTYKTRMNNRESFIVFLRKKAEPNKPYYTIECNLKKVLQFYSAYDRQPDKEEVQKILTKWMRQVRKNNRELSKAAV